MGTCCELVHLHLLLQVFDFYSPGVHNPSMVGKCSTTELALGVSSAQC